MNEDTDMEFILKVVLIVVLIIGITCYFVFSDKARKTNKVVKEDMEIIRANQTKSQEELKNSNKENAQLTTNAQTLNQTSKKYPCKILIYQMLDRTWKELSGNITFYDRETFFQITFENQGNELINLEVDKSQTPVDDGDGHYKYKLTKSPFSSTEVITVSTLSMFLVSKPSARSLNIGGSTIQHHFMMTLPAVDELAMMFFLLQ